MVDSIDSLFAEARRTFQAAGIDAAAQDARLLICGLLDLTLSGFMMRGGEALSSDDALTIRAAVKRRAAREPVHRILGARDFFGLTLGLSSGTLEPRPDTEILVERLIPFAERIAADSGACRILDLGTGTGAICLALLQTVPQATAIGCDISGDALSTAVANAARNGLSERFRPLESSWFTAVSGKFDIIVSNPPYIRSSVMATLEPEVLHHDPAAALDGGTDGLDAYRAIAAGAGAFLDGRGVVGLEIGFDQHQSVTTLFESRGFTLIDQAKDLGGNDRALVFRPGA
ncbi:peptide chain release factor N(5)-glutamine methyltransferase [Pararhizobium antarcticum]|uniref:Release factor glutamine methyltransferase n=1 Tax=Pararhizobium antarcticum TaxID=1798805 RepID=A0A657LL50_9HYPH|nr:peptide chain release factor N(5)-glutamine methyltransferase [Pararhizobium antarcticum]OJF90668.1 protein-(glutamine-N5) methyltransferase, release factor-specific [Rhizobium sp. 58]OJF90981.1 protein-(glutamine-N5) methyltransferase, release factor-specific [Pararhizobium antarcticum]